MRCTHCKGPIVSGVEAAKMIVAYQQEDASIKIFGYQMADGELTQATGRLHRAWHHKCFHVERKRAARGGAVDGSVLDGSVPSIYDIDQYVQTAEEAEEAPQRSTAELTEHAQRCLDMAAQVGRPVGDPYVLEAVTAQRHGGPYPHRHEMPLTVYQVRAHLAFAHGVNPVPQEVVQFHQRLHTEEMITDV